MSDEKTLRDTFAAAALTGVLANLQQRPDLVAATVRSAYQLADAMLYERAIMKTSVLTDAEREAVSIAANIIRVASEPHAATLRGLLARLEVSK